MQLYEYQVKALLAQFGLPVLRGKVAYTPRDAADEANTLGGQCMVKAQVHDSFPDTESEMMAFQQASDAEQVYQIADKMLSSILSVGDNQYCVRKVYVEEVVPSAALYYFVLKIDYVQQGFVICIHTPQKDKTFPVPDTGIPKSLAHKIAHALKMDKKFYDTFYTFLKNIFKFFTFYKLIACELCPVMLTKQNKFVILDARLIFDPDALCQYADITRLYETDERVYQRIVALNNNFKYVPMTGNIACLVNGSGLGKATLDLLHDYGGTPACLLDVGPDPEQRTIEKAFKTLLSQPQVDGILINIFGGTTRCDMITSGLIAASHEVVLRLPIVVRMDGTNAKIGERLLANARLPFQVCHQLDDAVMTIVQKVKEID